MKLNRWIAFSLISLALVGCARGPETKQAVEKTTPVTTSSPQPTQVKTTAQSANAAKPATVIPVALCLENTPPRELFGLSARMAKSF
jgi:PBP1b-binding outer membrane lipoprotein LpoB